MFIIKAIKNVFGFLYIMGLFFALMLNSCIKSCAHNTLSENLYNKSVLRFYDIPWLKKPENATKKSAYKGNLNERIYEAYIQDEQSFWDYGGYIYDTFVEKNYTIGAFVKMDYVSGGWAASSQWYLVKKPTNFEDCCKEDLTYQSGEIYALGEIKIYYSKKGLSSEKSINTRKDGYEMLQPRKITLTLREEQDGLFVMKISCIREPDEVFMIE